MPKLLLLALALLAFQDAEDFLAVWLKPGPKWDAKAPTEAHAAYWKALVEKGTLAQGGPLEGGGALMVLKGVKRDEAEKLAAGDPLVKAGVLAAEVRPWKRTLKELGPAILDPKDPRVNQKAPAEFKVKFETTRGDVVIKVTRAWAPLGADRFYNLAKNGYFDGCRFFRVLPNFVAQFGIHGDPRVAAAWERAAIQDDPVVKSNARGFVTYATAGPNTRTTQLFINTKDNRALDRMGFSPFGEVVEGMKAVEELYSGYGEGAPDGNGPSQGRLLREGNAYLEEEFPKLDFVKSAKVLE